MNEIISISDQVLIVFWRLFIVYLALVYHKKIYYAYAGKDGILDTNELSKAVITGLTIFVVVNTVINGFKGEQLTLILLAGLFALAGLDRLPLIKNIFKKDTKDESNKNS